VSAGCDYISDLSPVPAGCDYISDLSPSKLENLKEYKYKRFILATLFNST